MSYKLVKIESYESFYLETTKKEVAILIGQVGYRDLLRAIAMQAESDSNSAKEESDEHGEAQYRYLATRLAKAIEAFEL